MNERERPPARAPVAGAPPHRALLATVAIAIVLTVGMAAHAVLAARLRTQALVTAGLAVALVSTLAAGSRLVRRAWRRAEAATRALELQVVRNRTLLRTASDGLHVLDRGGRLVKFSDSFAEMLGRTRDELEGAHVTGWDAGREPAAIEAWLGTFEPGKRATFGTRHRRADGSLLDVEVTTAMLQVGDDDLVYCSARDVTQRRRLQAELAATAMLLRQLYDGAPCAYHSLDARGRYVHVNDTELAWLGCTREELVGKLTPTAFFTAEGRRLFQTHLPLVVSGQEVSGVEVDLVARDGTTRRVSVTAVPQFDGEGRFVMSRSVMYDISELHRTRLQLQAVLAEQGAMLDNDLVGMARLRDGRVAWHNRALAHLLAVEPHALAGASTRVFAFDDTSPAAAAFAAGVLATGERCRGQCALRRPDGRRIWIDLNGMRLSDDGRESIWLLADITPLRDAFERVEHLALHDGLTDLANRRLLRDRLERALASARRSGGLVALCYVDLDGFKAVNDRHGHACGDALLREVAERLSACVREADTVARLGGDEFAVLLAGLGSEAECAEIVARLEQQMHAQVTIGDGVRIALSASIGVALHPCDGDGGEALLAGADEAMYAAKRERDRKARYRSVLSA